MALPDMAPAMRPFARLVIVIIYPGLVVGAMVDLLVAAGATLLLWPVRWSRRRTARPPGEHRKVP